MQETARHQCLIYDGSPAVHLRSLALITLEKLKAGNRCLFLNRRPMVAGFRSYLAAAGLDVAQEVQKGTLVVSSDQSHLIEGRFDSDRMLRMLKSSLDRALDEGCTGLWATGDMMWELGSERNLEKLLEYELALDALLQKNPALGGICQYHRAILPMDSLQVALYTHASVCINETLTRINPLYAQPATLCDPKAGNHVADMLSRM